MLQVEDPSSELMLIDKLIQVCSKTPLICYQEYPMVWYLAHTCHSPAPLKPSSIPIHCYLSSRPSFPFVRTPFPTFHSFSPGPCCCAYFCSLAPKFTRSLSLHWVPSSHSPFPLIGAPVLLSIPPHCPPVPTFYSLFQQYIIPSNQSMIYLQ